MSQQQWVRLTGGDGEPGTWLNMAAVAAIRRDGRGRLRIELLGTTNQDPNQHPVVHHPADVAAILAYLGRATFTAADFAAAVEENPPEAPTPRREAHRDAATGPAGSAPGRDMAVVDDVASAGGRKFDRARPARGYNRDE
jgi:hypothetical protein